MGAEGKPRKRSQTSPSSSERLSQDCQHPAVLFVWSKYGWLMPCGTSQGRQKTAQDLLEVHVLLEQMLGARQMFQHTSPWQRGAERTRVEGRTAGHGSHPTTREVRCHHQPYP